MKLLQIQVGQAVWLLEANRPAGPPPLVELIQKVAARYKFQKHPSTLEELTGNERLFLVGKYRDIAINRLAVYHDGAIAETQAGVEAANEFLGDALAFLQEEYGFQVNSYPPVRRLYTSTVTVQMEVDLEAMFKGVSAISKAVTASVADSCGANLDYSVSGFYLYADTSAARDVPGPFRIERKVKEPHDANIYVSSAPLPTKEHLALLESLESLG